MNYSLFFSLYFKVFGNIEIWKFHRLENFSPRVSEEPMFLINLFLIKNIWNAERRSAGTAIKNRLGNWKLVGHSIIMSPQTKLASDSLHFSIFFSLS